MGLSAPLVGVVAARRSMAAQEVIRVGQRPGDAIEVEGLSFRWCPPGRFVMGSPAHEEGRRADEDQVSVTLTRGFWMGAFEVTQSQWRSVWGSDPQRPPTDEFGRGDGVPVYWVSHDEAVRWTDRLTESLRRKGQMTGTWTARLPTEAQWEYACRAGSTSAFAFGETLTSAAANVGPAQATGRIQGRAVPVGRYAKNAWGIADMHGNVFEWCLDWYHARLPGGVDPDRSSQPGEQNRDGSYSRCRRGGAWNDPPSFCRSALRLRFEPHRSSDHIGFRVALVDRA